MFPHQLLTAAPPLQKKGEHLSWIYEIEEWCNTCTYYCVTIFQEATGRRLWPCGLWTQ